jgi:anti-anti-sigma factor
MKIVIEKKQDGNFLVVTEGRLDADHAEALKEQLKKVSTHQPRVVVIDLSQTEFIDSSGLSALVSGLKALRENEGALYLCRPRPQALTALRLTMLDRVFPIYSSREEAFRQGDLLIP